LKEVRINDILKWKENLSVHIVLFASDTFKTSRKC